MTDGVTGREKRKTREKIYFRNELKDICRVSRGQSEGITDGSHFRTWHFFCCNYWEFPVEGLMTCLDV